MTNQASRLLHGIVNELSLGTLLLFAKFLNVDRPITIELAAATLAPSHYLTLCNFHLCTVKHFAYRAIVTENIIVISTLWPCAVFEPYCAL